MRLTSAIEREDHLEVTIDGRRYFAGKKYTILELGYAVYILMGVRTAKDDEWVRDNGETLPADPEGGRNELRSGAGMLITSDPILVALALESWWHRNGRTRPERRVSIPLLDEALCIVRDREILNDFNAKYQGTVPFLAKRLGSLPGTERQPTDAAPNNGMQPSAQKRAAADAER